MTPLASSPVTPCEEACPSENLPILWPLKHLPSSENIQLKIYLPIEEIEGSNECRRKLSKPESGFLLKTHHRVSRTHERALRVATKLC